MPEKPAVTGQFDTKAGGTPTATEKRSRTRTGSQLKAVVLGQTSSEDKWKEIVKVTSVSKSGAGFALSRECPVGSLVRMVLPMPAEFRAYDLDEELYQVVGLVQHCRPSKAGNKAIYDAGVGFIGKDVPESYKIDPAQSYRICGTSPEGLWAVTEAAAFRKRKAERFPFRLPVTISLIPKRKPSDEENAVTTDISSTGASLRSVLPLAKGDRVKFACEKYDFYAFAVVRGRRQLAKGVATLHLEFEDTAFPIEKVRK